MNLKTFVLFLLASVFSTHALSQRSFTISGFVVDKSNEPITSLEIILIRDSTAIKSEITNSKGYFSFFTESGNITLEIKHMGILISSKKMILLSDTVLGKIQLVTFTKQETAVITQQKPLFEKKPDKLIFNVEASLLAAGGDGIDVLNATPTLKVLNDRIMMIGKSGMNILLNGRSIGLSGDDLFQFLRNLKSSEIKKIEVITNPSAKYDAEGNSGIVNIITKTAAKNSFLGGLNFSWSQANKAIAQAGSNVTYQKKNITFMAFLNHSNGSIEPIQEFTLNYPNSIWRETNLKRNFISNTSAKLNIEYSINPKWMLGCTFSHANSNPVLKTNDNSYIFSTNESLDSSIINTTRLSLNRITNNLSVYSGVTLDTLGRRMQIDLDVLQYSSTSKNNFFSNSFDLNGSLKPNSFFSALNNGDLDFSIITSRIDFEYPTQKRMSLNFGAKLSFIKNLSNINFFNKTSGVPILDPNQTNEFNYEEKIQALYASAAKNLGKKLSLQLGMRLENTQTTGFSRTLNQVTKNNYLRLFPSFYATYPFKDYQTLSFAYNKRIQRPSYNDLNPFRYYSTSFNYSEGNPYLQPFFSHNLELSLSHKDLYFMVFGSIIRNSSNEVALVSPNSIIQIVKPINFLNQYALGFFQGYNFRVKNSFESNNSVSVVYNKSVSTIEQIIPTISKVSGNFTSANAIALDKKKNFKAEVQFFYQLPSVVGSYALSGYSQLDIGFRCALMQKKLQLGVNFMDVYKGSAQVFQQSVNTIGQRNYDYADTRRIKISLTYNFGKKLNKQEKNAINEEEKGRIK
jgi:hypothetical protein